MATALDFKKQAKYTTQTVEVANFDGFQVIAGNYYRLPVTINNTGKSVKTNYYVNIIVKHFDLYLKYKSNYNFGDLRVYDTDGVTELEFYVQNQLSTNTCVFVKLPTLAASSRVIYFEYGNNGLANKSLDVNDTPTSSTFWNFNKNNFRDWFIAQNATRTERAYYRPPKIIDPIDGLKIGNNNFANPTGTYTNGIPFTQLGFGIPEPLAGRNFTNFRQRFNSAHLPLRFNVNQPYIRCAEWDPTLAINGLDTMEFGRIQRNEVLYTNSLTLDPLDEYRNFYCFAVFKTKAVGTTHYLFGTHEINGKTVLINAANQVAIVTDGVSAICTHTTVLLNNTDYIIECSLQFTGGTGYNARIRINGVEQTFSGTQPTMNTNFKWSRLGNSRGGNDSLVGCLAEFGWCNGFNTSSADDTNFRNGIYQYLNTKYKIVSSSDFPTVTLGNETTLTPNANTGYNSISTLCEYNYSQSLSNVIYGTEKSNLKINIKKNLQKYWLGGKETFDNSTLDSSGNFLTTKFSQVYNATDSSSYTLARFDLVLNAENQTNLGTFSTKDIISGANYPINDEDYICLEINITNNLNVDYAQSFIEFSDTSNFVNRKTANLVGQYFVEGINTIYLKKSEFSEVNSLTWESCIFFRARFRMLAGETDTIRFGLGRILKNYETFLVPNTKIRIGDSVSLDGFNADIFTANKNILTVQSVFTSEEDVEIECDTILEKFLKSKFRDLPGFPTDGRPLYIGTEKEGFPLETVHFKNFVLKQLFCLAFPYDILDFEDIDTVTSSIIDLVPYFVFRGEDEVENKINEILGSTFSSIYFDSNTGKIKFKNGVNLISGVPTKFVTQHEILDYKVNTTSNLEKINKINIQRYERKDSRNAVFGGRQFISTIFGFGGKFEEVGAGQNRDFFFDITDGVDSDIVFLEYLRIDGFNFATTQDPTVPGLNNSGIRIRSVRFLAPSTVVISVNNTNTSPRFFYALNLQSGYVQENKSNIAVYNNVNSQKNFGVQEITTELKMRVFGDLTAMQNNLFQGVVDRFGQNQQKYELEINNQKDLEFIENTAFFDKKNLLKQGNIIGINEVESNTKTIEIIASSIRPAILSIGDYLTQENGFLFLLEDGSGALLLE